MTYMAEGECELIVMRDGLNNTQKCTNGFTFDDQFDTTIVTDVRFAFI